MVLSVLGALACDGDPTPTKVIPLGLRPIVTGEAHLAGFAAGACSRGQPASGDGHRYCAFYRIAPGDTSRTELWVVDVSAALSGSPAPCDGTSSGCLLLTDHLFTGVKLESLSHPEAHRFEGDTLLYLADPNPASAQLDRFEGRVWAWRPGWKRPRALTTDRGVHCRASESAAVAYCVDGVTDRPQAEFDLRAGRLDEANDEPLAVVERLRAIVQGNLAWSAAFTPAGDAFVYSSWPDGAAAQALRVLPLNGGRISATEARTVISSGRHFTLSPDGRAVYFQRGGDRGQERGDLWAADFPSGQGEGELAKGVFSFTALGRSAGLDLGVLYLTEMGGLEGVLSVLRDRRRPDSAQILSHDAHFWYPSADANFTYVLEVTQNDERGILADNRTGTSCRLGSRGDVPVYNPDFLPALRAVLWTEPDPGNQDNDLSFLGTPEDCGGVRPLGPGIEQVLPAGRSGVFYLSRARKDDKAPTTLFHVPVLADGPLRGQGTAIVTDLDIDNLTRLDWSNGLPEALVLGTRAGAAQGQGLFVFGPLQP